MRPHNRSIRGGLFRILKSLPEFLSAAARSAAATDALHDANLLQDIKKRLGVAALEAEMADHFGYEWIEVEGNNTGNSRNGSSSRRNVGHTVRRVDMLNALQAGDSHSGFIS